MTFGSLVSVEVKFGLFWAAFKVRFVARLSRYWQEGSAKLASNSRVSLVRDNDR